jgi:hypothetical protein
MPMTTDDSYEAPFQVDDEAMGVEHRPATAEEGAAESVDAGADVHAADATIADVDFEDNAELSELAQPFVGQWNQLISKTNWEKGRIISGWREALIDSGADATQYSDEAWARRVGGVTAPHVGRLRRVHDRFVTTFETYDGLYWSHFLAALDWDDAPLWLEGASRESWSVAAMREQRWQALGAVESQRPTASQIIEVDTDEDITLPAQGGGRTKEYGDEPDAVASGPRHEDPDFGDEEELTSLAGSPPQFGSPSADESADAPVAPFAGLPDLPDDLADAIESLKLSLLRHKTAGWRDTTADIVQQYLDAISLMVRS